MAIEGHNITMTSTIAFSLSITIFAAVLWDCFRRWVALQHARLREESDTQAQARAVEALSKRLDVHEAALKQALLEMRERLEEYDSKFAAVGPEVETKMAGTLAALGDARSWGR